MSEGPDKSGPNSSLSAKWVEHEGSFLIIFLIPENLDSYRNQCSPIMAAITSYAYGRCHYQHIET